MNGRSQSLTAPVNDMQRASFLYLAGKNVCRVLVMILAGFLRVCLAKVYMPFQIWL